MIALKLHLNPFAFIINLVLLILCDYLLSSFFTQRNMTQFEVKQSGKLNLTSYSGLALIGQCCQAAQAGAVIDPLLLVASMRTSELVKSMVGLLSLGRSDFEAIEPFRQDRFSGIAGTVQGSWQRADAPVARYQRAKLRELTDELSLRLIERTEAPITVH